MSGLGAVVLLAVGLGRPVPPPPVFRTAPKARPMAVNPAAGVALNMSATPASITFQGTDPDSSTVAGSSAATVTWVGFGSTASWNLTVQAPSTTFQGCPTVPVSAVRVSCSSAAVTGGGTAACAASTTLSTTPQIVASGNQGFFSSYTVTLTFTLTDSWKFIAETSPQCSLSVTYTSTLN
jgi:hypothetical protein